MQMLPPQLAMMQAASGQAKPLFPSAIPSSSPGGSAIVGADFKPITTGVYYFILSYFHECEEMIESRLKKLTNCFRGDN